MKQTNNAIKFLMAQYRAIFKHAYLKGLVSAAVLTAGLALSATASANSPAPDAVFGANGETLPANNETVIIDGVGKAPDQEGSGGAYKFITIAQDGILTGWDGTIQITSGSGTAAANSITGAGNNGSLSGNGSLVIIGDGDTGLLLTGGAGDGKSVTINIGEINVQKGTLTISGGSTATSNASALANTITLGVNTNETVSGSISLTGTAADKSATLGDDSSEITINKTGDLSLNGFSTVNASELTVNSGTITISTGASNVIQATSATFNGGTLSVAEGLKLSGGTFNLNNIGSFVSANTTDDTKDTVTLASGSTLEIDGGKLAKFLSGTNASTSGTLELEGNATLNISGEITLGATANIDIDAADSKKGIGTSTSSTIIAETINLASAITGNSGTISTSTLNISNASAVTSTLGNLTVSKKLNSSVATGTATTIDSTIKLHNTESSGTITATAAEGFEITTAEGVLDIQGKWNSSAKILLSGTAPSLNLTGNGNSLTFTAKTLELGKAATVSVDSGAALTFNTGAGLSINATDTVASFTVDDASVVFNTGSTLYVKSGSFTVTNSTVNLKDATITGDATGNIIASGSDAIIEFDDLGGTGIIWKAVDGGTLKADELNSLTGITLEGDASTLEVDTVSLGATSTGINASTTGVVQINKKLTADGAISFAQGNLQFGDENGGSSGAIEKDLTLNGATATIYGGWTGKAVSLAGTGALTVGGNSITSSFTADKIADSTATGGITVNAGATMTVNGVKTNVETAGEDDYYGFNLAGKTVDVNGGKFIIGSTGAAGLIATQKDWANFDADTSDIFANYGEYNLSSGGVLEILFADGTELSISDLALLKNELADAENGVIANGKLNIGEAEITGITTGPDAIIKEDPATGNLTVTADNYNLVAGSLSDVQQKDFMQATVTGVSKTFVGGHVGSLELAAGETVVEITGDTSLNKADANGNLIYTSGSKTAADATIAAGQTFEAATNGNVGDITLTASADENSQTTFNLKADNTVGDITVDTSNGGTYTAVSVTGKVTAGDIKGLSSLSNTKSLTAQAVTVDNFTDAQDASTTVKSFEANEHAVISGTVKVEENMTLTSTKTTEEGTENSQVNGTVTVGKTLTAGNTDFGKTSVVETQDAVFNGNSELNGSFTAKTSTTIGTEEVAANVTVNGLASFGDLKLVAKKADNTASNLTVLGDVTTNNLTGVAGAIISVGQDAEGDYKSQTGSMEVKGTLDLNGSTLKTDPSYGDQTALVAVKRLQKYDTAKDGNDVGIFNGNVFVGQNSALGVGVTKAELQGIIADYQQGGSFLDPNEHETAYGAMLYLDKTATIGENQGITLTAGTAKALADKITQVENGGTVTSSMHGFDGSASYAVDNTIYFGDNTALAINTDTKLKQNQAYITFDSQSAGTLVADGGEIVLMGKTLQKSLQLFESDTELLNLDGTDTDAAIDVKTQNEFLIGTLTNDNKGKVTLEVNEDKAASIMTGASKPVFDTILAYARGYNGAYVENEADIAQASKLYASYDAETDTYNYDYNNYFLSQVVYSGNGSDVEKVARLGVYGGTAQAALAAGSSTTDAVAGRMGMGAQAGSITFADNGQGAGLWVAPIYKNHDSDGFGAQGVSYGTDLDMYGVALGGDYTMANGLRVGAAFNVGSGDADGQGAGAGVSNDFDYYGFSIYGGYTMGALSVVGDISYTVVDNDITGNTAIEKISASMDSTNLSFGVTGAYAMDVNGFNVTPHAGLRFTQIDMDDYTVKGESDIAHYSADSANIFSIPVGITFSKDIVTGSWTVKSALDLTLTANMGDDSVDGNVTWSGVQNLHTNVESEVIDSFTYGANLGVAAKSGNFSFGFGLNYTGASNADEYGVNANARFVF